MMIFELHVNGDRVRIDCPPLRRLLDVLREDLRLTGSKEGCGEGECGACLALMDDLPVNTCLIPVAQAHQRRITTIEGLESDPLAQHLIKVMVDKGAVQCGFCTPGMVISAYALLKRVFLPTPDDVRQALAGNICRCTGYQKIVDAVIFAGKTRHQTDKPAEPQREALR